MFALDHLLGNLVLDYYNNHLLFSLPLNLNKTANHQSYYHRLDLFFSLHDSILNYRPAPLCLKYFIQLHQVELVLDLVHVHLSVLLVDPL